MMTTSGCYALMERSNMLYRGAIGRCYALVTQRTSVGAGSPRHITLLLHVEQDGHAISLP